MTKSVHTKLLKFVVEFLFLFQSVDSTDPLSRRERRNTVSSMQEVYNACPPLSPNTGQLCFGLPNSNCFKTRSCYIGIIANDTESDIIVRFGEDHTMLHSAESYYYIFGVSIDPFVYNAVGIPNPICKETVTANDFIMRIFQSQNGTRNYFSDAIIAIGQEYIGGFVSRSIAKSEWTNWCRRYIMEEYYNSTNEDLTGHKRSLVFRNKFYYNWGQQGYQVTNKSVRVTVLTFHGFNDPDQYYTKDGRIYLNFNETTTKAELKTPDISEPDSGTSGSTKFQIRATVTSLLIVLTAIF